MGYNAGGGKGNNQDSNQKKGKKNELSLTFSLFFDGNLCSKANIEEGKSLPKKYKYIDKFLSNGLLGAFEYFPYLHMISRKNIIANNESYNKDKSNIVRLYEQYNEDELKIPIYIEGSGTKPRNLLPPCREKFDLGEMGKKFFLGHYDTADEYGHYSTCSDDELASEYGIGEFGIKAKVERACEMIKEIIEDFCFDKDYDPSETKLDLKIYVFGFGRGAASARCFCSNIKEKKCKTAEFTQKDVENLYKQLYPIKKKIVSGILGYSTISTISLSAAALTFWLENYGGITSVYSFLPAPAGMISAIIENKVRLHTFVTVPGITGFFEGLTLPFYGKKDKLKNDLQKENRINICLDVFLKKEFKSTAKFQYELKFLGLFDTVSAYGPKYEDDVDELALKKVRNVSTYHICAGDEYRLNYDLTDISSYGGNSIIIPGCHEDIGGKSSNLYSLVSYNLMLKACKDKIFNDISDYKIDLIKSRVIDGIKHDDIDLMNRLKKFYDNIESISNEIYSINTDVDGKRRIVSNKRSKYLICEEVINSFPQTIFPVDEKILNVRAKLESDRNINYPLDERRQDEKWLQTYKKEHDEICKAKKNAEDTIAGMSDNVKDFVYISKELLTWSLDLHHRIVVKG